MTTPLPQPVLAPQAPSDEVRQQAIEALDAVIPPHLRTTRHGENFMGQRYEIIRAALALGRTAPPADLHAAKYDDVLLPFLSLMRKELHANSAKGDRPGWLSMDPNTALLEVYWHAAKLSAAVKNNDAPAIMEHSADVANMAMMTLDVCVGLAFVEAA